MKLAEIRVNALLKKISEADQKKLDYLLAKNEEGVITPSERLELRRLVARAEKILRQNAEMLGKGVAGR